SAGWFGFDNNGCDIYTRTLYGARASMMVGTFAVLSVLIIGSVLGTIAGYYGGWVDAIISRLGDIFFGIPLLLRALLLLVTYPSEADTPQMGTSFKVVLALGVLGWPQIIRIMRSSVWRVRSSDYLQAARALGHGDRRALMTRIVQNA